MRTARHNAFTFVEVLAALAIASIALLGLLRLHLVSVRTADAAHTRAQAVFVARSKIAETLCSGHQEPQAQSGTVEADGLDFVWRTELTRVNVPQLSKLGVQGLQQLRVDVTWREGSGEKTVNLTTYVADSRINE